MESLCFYSSLPPIPPFQKTVTNPINCHNFPSKTNPLRLFPSLSTSSKFKLHCLGRAEEDSVRSSISKHIEIVFMSNYQEQINCINYKAEAYLNPYPEVATDGLPD